MGACPGVSTGGGGCDGQATKASLQSDTALIQCTEVLGNLANK